MADGTDKRTAGRVIHGREGDRLIFHQIVIRIANHSGQRTLPLGGDCRRARLKIDGSR
jgi:hypothetical protein